MNIYLIRHTEYDNPEGIYPFHLPVHLSEKGKKDAIKIGEWLVKNKSEKLPIYSSPIVRCVETSKLISSQTKSLIKIDDRLIEVSCSNLQGKKKPKEKPWLFEEKDESRESKEEMIKRMKSIYKERIKEEKDCILVSHGDPIVFFYFDLIGKKLPKYRWNPENRDIIVRKGEVVKIKVENGKLVKAEKINPLLD